MLKTNLQQGNGLGQNELLRNELSMDKVKPSSLSPLSYRSDGFSGAKLGYMGTVQEVSFSIFDYKF